MSSGLWSTRSPRLVQAGAILWAAMTALLFALILVSLDAAAVFASDNMLRLGHVTAYLAAVLVGVPSVWAVYRVFRSALAFERSDGGLAPPSERN